MNDLQGRIDRWAPDGWRFYLMVIASASFGLWLSYILRDKVGI